MGLLRALLLFVIAYIAFRLVRSFMKIRGSSDSDDRVNPHEAGMNRTPAHDDLPRGEIRDAEFEDLTPPEKPTEPPKPS
jgi:hypothetical protein